MRLLTAVLLIVLFTAAAPVAAQEAQVPDGETVLVVSVIDGDTIDVEFPSGEILRVRYIGVDTAERSETCYRPARLLNAGLLDGQTVTLVRDRSETDRYGRLLRYVYAGDLFVNAELVRQGYAEAVDFPPDTANSALFHELQDEAATGGYGCLWGGAAAPDFPARFAVETTRYVIGSTINVRSCERTTCDRVATLTYGATVTVIGQVEGEAVSGSTAWIQVRLPSGEAAYIHSSLLDNVAPATPRPVPVNSVISSQGNNPAGPAVSTPAPAPISTPVPPPPGPAYACNCSKTCTQMTCDEAYFQLQQCGCGQRDGDGDGRPCESQCGG